MYNIFSKIFRSLNMFRKRLNSFKPMLKLNSSELINYLPMKIFLIVLGV